MNPPKNPKSKKFKKIVRRGCGGYNYSTPNGEEYDCHFYDWECDYCPVLIDNETANSTKNKNCKYSIDNGLELL